MNASPTPRRSARPNPAQWLWYIYGGTLPQRYREWVLHDLTCRTRWPRQVVRTSATMVPFAILGVAILGPTWITWTALLGGLAIALIYGLSYVDQSAEHRLTKHGYPFGTLQQTLADAHANAEQRDKYLATYRSAPSA
ncbi:MAG: DUF5313 family protein [Mycobacterium sp.]